MSAPGPRLPHRDAADLERAISDAFLPVKSYNTRAIRRLSVLSNVIPPSLKGAGLVIKATAGVAHVERLTNARLDVLAALQCIGDERRRRYERLRARGGGGPGGGADDDGGDDELDICMAGFAVHVWTSLGQLIPIPLSDGCVRMLYHDGGMCGLTGTCPVEDCAAVAAAAARAAADAAGVGGSSDGASAGDGSDGEGEIN